MLSKFVRNVGLNLLIIVVAVTIFDAVTTNHVDKSEISYTNFFEPGASEKSGCRSNYG